MGSDAIFRCLLIFARTMSTCLKPRSADCRACVGAFGSVSIRRHAAMLGNRFDHVLGRQLQQTTDVPQVMCPPQSTHSRSAHATSALAAGDAVPTISRIR